MTKQNSRSRTTKRTVDRLAFPAIIAGIAEPVISLVDTAFVGRLGTADLAAVGISSSFFLLVVWVLAQTRSAVLAVVARYYGEDRLEDVKDLVPIAIWMNFGLGLLFFTVTNAYAEPIFRMYNADGAVLEKAVAYFKIRSIGFPVVLATFAVTGVFRGIQNMSWSMWTSLIGAGVNLILNPLLIFGAAGIPAMGVEGSALASLIAQLVMFGYVLHVMDRRTTFRIVPRVLKHRELGALVGLSGNLFLRTIALNVCYYLGNRFATGYGEAYIGAHAIAMQIWLFSAFFIDGYSAAGSVLAGRLNGERNWKDLYRVSWQVVKRSIHISLGLGLVFLIGYRWTAGIFSPDPTVGALFNSIYWMVIITQPINAIAFGFDGIYKGLGQGALLRNVLFFTTVLGFVPVILLADSLGWMLYAIWSAFLVWMVGRAGCLTLHFQRNYAPARRGP